MEMESMMMSNNKSITVSSATTTTKKEEDDDDVPLPGFRFHPTDEELVSFYLRRKVEKRRISIELIKQIDIYKYDPWDLPKGSNVGDKEWYFFCKRGRKYRNSVRPNRVTGSGFWKATGIDKPIYSTGVVNGEAGGRDCVGLKKSLVFYRGSAGKGTKTDWMMHEFRLPADHDKGSHHFDHVKTIAQEAEVWTLCRIFKRNVSHKKCIPDWKEIAAAKRSTHVTSKSTDHMIMGGLDCNYNNNNNYISFNYAPTQNEKIKNPALLDHDRINIHEMKPFNDRAPTTTTTSNYSSFVSSDFNEILKHADWDELSTVVEFDAADSSFF